ncbi:hypothetical protein [Rufibacter sp. LB8]|uniref:hypothetical protein n=1 Tax=Rufibacter sp. LB8 TaxID=2777781 RepID=UPI00178C1B90|nr:hypothetical protein [Rufibacter sp. LB8]
MNKKLASVFLLLFAFTIMLAHNVVPHHHHDGAHPKANSDNTEHAHEHDHQKGHNEHSPVESGQDDHPVPDANHLLSNHQHSFADNTSHYSSDQSNSSFNKKQLQVALITSSYYSPPQKWRPEKMAFPPSGVEPGLRHYSEPGGLRGPPVA